MSTKLSAKDLPAVIIVEGGTLSIQELNQLSKFVTRARKDPSMTDVAIVESNDETEIRIEPLWRTQYKAIPGYTWDRWVKDMTMIGKNHGLDMFKVIKRAEHAHEWAWARQQVLELMLDYAQSADVYLAPIMDVMLFRALTLVREGQEP